MKLYRELTEEENKILKKYTKLFENVKISEPAMYAGNLYREVVFSKKFGKDTHYIYLDSNNNPVKDRITLLRLGRLFFFMDCYLNDEKGSIIHALQTDEDMTRDKDDMRLTAEALDLVSKKASKYDIKPNDIVDIKNTLSKIIVMRQETNKKLDDFRKKVELQMKENKYFSEAVIEKCMPEYKEVMVINYDKVKMISAKNNCYGSVKRAAEKMRTSYNLRFITGHTEQLSKLQYTMGYFQNLITAYGSILDMSCNQYLKSIENAGKVNAEFKMQQMR